MNKLAFTSNKGRDLYTVARNLREKELKQGGLTPQEQAAKQQTLQVLTDVLDRVNPNELSRNSRERTNMALFLRDQNPAGSLQKISQDFQMAAYQGQLDRNDVHDKALGKDARTSWATMTVGVLNSTDAEFDQTYKHLDPKAIKTRVSLPDQTLNTLTDAAQQTGKAVISPKAIAAYLTAGTLVAGGAGALYTYYQGIAPVIKEQERIEHLQQEEARGRQAQAEIFASQQPAAQPVPASEWRFNPIDQNISLPSELVSNIETSQQAVKANNFAKLGTVNSVPVNIGTDAAEFMRNAEVQCDKRYGTDAKAVIGTPIQLAGSDTATAAIYCGR